VRLVATGLGIVAVLVGLVCAVAIFAEIYGTAKDPASIEDTLAQWAEAIGGTAIQVEIDGESFPVARAAAVAVLGVTGVMLCWLAVGIMLAGAKVVSWTSGDYRAAKKVLKEAMAGLKGKGNAGGS